MSNSRVELGFRFEGGSFIPVNDQLFRDQDLEIDLNCRLLINGFTVKTQLSFG
jgi:hypothetical protein